MLVSKTKLPYLWLWWKATIRSADRQKLAMDKQMKGCENLNQINQLSSGTSLKNLTNSESW